VILDNVVWHALTGPQRAFAQGTPCALRFDPAVAPFAALPDDASVDAWSALAGVVGPGNIAVLFRADTDPPPEWDVVTSIAGVQMIAPDYGGAPGNGIVELGSVDVPDMLALVERTRPGPFFARTHELGRYVGIRDGGRLVAMAGERLRCESHTEISAVCTDREYRGLGYATQLVGDLVANISARGDTPFLHAMAENSTAIHLYETLGFEVRTRIDGFVARAPAAGEGA